MYDTCIATLTVIPLAHLIYNLVHCPAIQLVVGEDLQWKSIFDLILLDSLPRLHRQLYNGRRCVQIDL